jgi:hypothetical protein
MLYCRLAPPYFFTLSHKQQDFRKKSYRIENAGFDFLKVSHFKKNSARYYHKYKNVFI